MFIIGISSNCLAPAQFPRRVPTAQNSRCPAEFQPPSSALNPSVPRFPWQFRGRAGHFYSILMQSVAVFQLTQGVEIRIFPRKTTGLPDLNFSFPKPQVASSTLAGGTTFIRGNLGNS